MQRVGSRLPREAQPWAFSSQVQNRAPSTVLQQGPPFTGVRSRTPGLPHWPDGGPAPPGACPEHPCPQRPGPSQDQTAVAGARRGRIFPPAAPHAQQQEARLGLLCGAGHSPEGTQRLRLRPVDEEEEGGEPQGQEPTQEPWPPAPARHAPPSHGCPGSSERQRGQGLPRAGACSRRVSRHRTSSPSD